MILFSCRSSVSWKIGSFLVFAPSLLRLEVPAVFRRCYAQNNRDGLPRSRLVLRPQRVDKGGSNYALVSKSLRIQLEIQTADSSTTSAFSYIPFLDSRAMYSSLQ